MQTYDYERSPLGRLTFALILVGTTMVVALRMAGWLA